MAVTVNAPDVPTVNAAAFALVIAGATRAGPALYAITIVVSVADTVVVPVAV
jgi:hypothetical protein